MLLTTLQAKKDTIHALADQCGARHIRVFGSVARREDLDSSDVDFLVEFPEGYDLFGQRIKLSQALEDLLGRKVDLIPEHELNPHIRAKILSEAVEI